MGTLRWIGLKLKGKGEVIVFDMIGNILSMYLIGLYIKIINDNYTLDKFKGIPRQVEGKEDLCLTL